VSAWGKSEVEEQKKTDAFNFVNFSFVLLVAFFAAYPFFWDYVNLETRERAISAFLWSMAFVVGIGVIIVLWAKSIRK
jgi:hypothetical protein